MSMSMPSRSAHVHVHAQSECPCHKQFQMPEVSPRRMCACRMRMRMPAYLVKDDDRSRRAAIDRIPLVCGLSGQRFVDLHPLQWHERAMSAPRVRTRAHAPTGPARSVCVVPRKHAHAHLQQISCVSHAHLVGIISCACACSPAAGSRHQHKAPRWRPRSAARSQPRRRLQVPRGGEKVPAPVVWSRCRCRLGLSPPLRHRGVRMRRRDSTWPKSRQMNWGVAALR